MYRVKETKIPKKISKMEIPASYIADHKGHCIVSVYEGIRVRNFKPVSTLKFVSDGPEIVKIE